MTVSTLPGEASNLRSREPAWLAAPAWPAAMSRRQRFLRAAHCRPVDYAPVWLMRQAGRVLPEYRALKEKHSFLELVQTPDLAAEVTLQPIRRFDFDAAILFSDILVVPEALGQAYCFRETGGVQMEFTLRSAGDIARLHGKHLRERLDYVTAALRLLRAELGDRTALLGFCGSPWTLATFMMEGGSAPEYTRARALFREQPGLFELLMHKLTDTIVDYLQMQIEAGVDAVQIFDSHGGLLPAEEFDAASGKWLKQIVARLRGQVPVIVFSKGTYGNWDTLVATGANVLGIDYGIPLAEARRRVPETVALQGNLDPGLLVEGSPEQVAAATGRVLDAMRGRPGHIFNLGHGVPPASRLDNVAAMISTIRKPL